MVMGLGLLRRLNLADERADAHAVKLGDLAENIHVRQALAPLPFGDGFVGIIELRRKIELRVMVRLAVLRDVLRHRFAQGCFVGLQFVTSW